MGDFKTSFSAHLEDAELHLLFKIPYLVSIKTNKATSFYK